MKSIKGFFKKNSKWVIPVVLAVLTISAATTYALINNSKVNYKYDLINGSKGTFVFEYGQKIDYQKIASEFNLTYEESTVSPLYKDSVQTEALLSDSSDIIYVTMSTIDSKQVTHPLKNDVLKELTKLDKHSHYDFIVNLDHKIKPLTAQLEVYRKTGKDIKRVAKESVDYVVIDTVPPTLENVQDMTIQVGQEVDTSQMKAKDPIDGDLKVSVTNKNFNKSKAGTYEFMANAVDKNGLEISKEFKVNVVEEKVASTDTGETLPNTGQSTSGGSNTSGQQSGGNGYQGNNSSGGNQIGGNSQGGQTPAPVTPVEPQYVCPTADIDKNQPCDAKISRHMIGYHGTYSTMQACKDAGYSKEQTQINGYYVDNWSCSGKYYNDSNLGSWYSLELMTIDDSGVMWWILVDGSLHDGS
ncbi:hypothetical protein [Erysipelothrix anatis]|uniref:hypothetical protein n=1 Tax=Erysipelothrix anatis TaxID=2683713 RepID=UPI00140C3EC0|nr:hypothetical protein [Erysipelothrix anatis]